MSTGMVQKVQILRNAILKCAESSKETSIGLHGFSYSVKS